MPPGIPNCNMAWLSLQGFSQPVTVVPSASQEVAAPLQQPPPPCQAIMDAGRATSNGKLPSSGEGEPRQLLQQYASPAAGLEESLKAHAWPVPGRVLLPKHMRKEEDYMVRTPAARTRSRAAKAASQRPLILHCGCAL